MRIHFITAVTNDVAKCKYIISILEKLGHELITKHFVERKIREIENESETDSIEYIRKSRKWIKDAEIVIFETTVGDVSVGYELALAVQSCKPIIAIYQSKLGNIPYSLKGIQSEKIQMYGYEREEIKDLLISAIEYAETQMETRFNLFLTQETRSYLNWISSNRRIPKSVVVRDLILEMKKTDSSYQETLI